MTVYATLKVSLNAADTTGATAAAGCPDGAAVCPDGATADRAGCGRRAHGASLVPKLLQRFIN